MKNKTKKPKRTGKVSFYTAGILLCLVMASICLMQNLYARYVTKSGGSDSARVAIFGHDETVALPGLTKQLVPGDTRTGTITVTNQTKDTDGSTRTSEVAQKYSIEVVTAGNLPLTYTLTQNGTTIDSFTESNKSAHTFSTENMTFAAGTAGSATYTLTVIWPDTEKDAKYAGIPDYVQINVKTEQID